MAMPKPISRSMAQYGPNSMQAAMVVQFNQPYVLKRILKPPEPEGTDMMIKVLAASYCSTDAVFHMGNMFQNLPRVGSHEFAGEIVSMGPDVEEDLKLAVGMRVGVPGRAYHVCGVCWECEHNGQDRPGYSSYCPKAFNLGLNRDGGFQEYAIVDSKQVVPLPDGLSAIEAAPLMCAGVTIWAALHHPRIRSAQTIAIIGAGGGLGHLGTQFAAHLGMEVLAIDITDVAMELLNRLKMRLGPAGRRVHVADGRREGVKDMQARILGPDSINRTPKGEVGLDAAVMLCDSQTAFDQGMQLLRHHSTMMLLSFPKKKLEISAGDVVFRDINVVGSLVGRNHQIREMLQFVSMYDVHVEVTPYKFGDVNKLANDYRKGNTGKLVIDMSMK